MQAIRRKLNSQRGASMLMTLLLMLVGIMVSAVIISAATSAAVVVCFMVFLSPCPAAEAPLRSFQRPGICL